MAQPGRWGWGQDRGGNPVPLTKEQFERFHGFHVRGRDHDADCWSKCIDCGVESCTELGMYTSHPEYVCLIPCDDCLDDVCQDCWDEHKAEHALYRHLSAQRYPLVSIGGGAL